MIVMQIQVVAMQDGAEPGKDSQAQDQKKSCKDLTGFHIKNGYIHEIT